MPEVKLLQPHTHAGKRLAAGETLTVSDTEATWLREHNVIEVVLPVMSDVQSSRGKNKQQEPEDNGAA
ncbi:MULTISPECIES: hypothetical protein [Klebsiella]|uniref:DUF7210 family protein n=1 Tax=Klebsiella TaxID=570 RepID=UPI000C7AEE56|nr:MULTISPECIES: hypothetical protein [Klebsiella]HDT5879652.1 hypothetical protein [Klebsiella quasipneumoniae subsp. similipneumoniae]EKU2002634.1 hypothetical protein [Klebsiella pneumoniae]EKW4019204.1 hypothetical protein [Klebsiella pneumoniae]ELB4696007.1 hypothetical protein [Klebsiella pneumoniae]ELB5143863.1 hypothetical protein [Klebsiella pneumoniae]